MSDTHEQRAYKEQRENLVRMVLGLIDPVGSAAAQSALLAEALARVLRQSDKGRYEAAAVASHYLAAWTDPSLLEHGDAAAACEGWIDPPADDGGW